MDSDVDPSWIAVLNAIEQLRSRGEVPTSDKLPFSVLMLDQMINARWIAGVVVRSGSTPSRERILGITLTPLGRRKLRGRTGGTGQQEDDAIRKEDQ